MAWFKVDDLLSAHRKARRAGLEAIGLWTLAGSHCAQQLTDGFVPEWFVLSWPHGDEAAKKLVDAGLWTEAEHGSEIGWQFHDWTDYQPTRDQVEDEREARRERQRRWRATRSSTSTDASVDTSRSASRDPSTDASRRTSRDTSHNASHDAVGNTAPARPVPSTKSVVTLVGLLTSAGARGVTTTTIEHWATKNTPGIDIDTETARFLEVNAGKDIHDLRAAWQAWMRAAKPAAERVTVPASKAGSTDRATLRPDDPRCDKPGHEHELASKCRLCRSEQLAAETDDQTEERTDP